MILYLSLMLSPAFGCPTIATGTTSPLQFDVAQVAIVRQDGRTTFSVSVNPTGTAQEFALVMPVPEVLTQDQVRTLDSKLFATLNGYTAPRHVNDAGCASGGDADSDIDADTDTDTDGGAGADVEIEAFYLVGEYAVTILSAQESSALFTWLDDRGYSLPDGAEDRLGEYIEAGSFFLAAKVADTAALADGSPLSPLQIAYDSPLFSIPIRLATLNSPGEQDMVIYAIVDEAEGRVGIANYPEVFIEDTCMWGEAAIDDFADFYEDHYTAAWEVAESAAWGVEFSGGLNDCNPCTDTYPTAELLEELGFRGAFEDHYMTRLHVRYTTEQATQDLSLYSSGIKSALTTSFADETFLNKKCIEFYCDGTPTWGGDSDTDTDTDTDTDRDTGAVADTDTDTDNELDTDSDADADSGDGSSPACGCQAIGSGGWMVLLLPLTALIGRRRRAEG
jgi:uncharacterized protein (TIGR03382 family)